MEGHEEKHKAQFLNAVMLALTRVDIQRSMNSYNWLGPQKLEIVFSEDVSEESLKIDTSDLGMESDITVERLDDAQGKKLGLEGPGWRMIVLNKEIDVPENLDVIDSRGKEVDGGQTAEQEVKEVLKRLDRAALRRIRELAEARECLLAHGGLVVKRRLIESAQFKCPVCQAVFDLAIKLIDAGPTQKKAPELEPEKLETPELPAEAPGAELGGGFEPPTPAELGGGGAAPGVEEAPPVESLEKRFDRLVDDFVRTERK